ncbi:MAG: sigma 54-interacting transcriptional regulator, partial [Acidobacteriota bacterium]
MSVSGPRGDRGPGRARSDELLDLAHRITLSCPAAAVLLEAGGRVRALNDAAESLLELGGDLTGRSARALFGLGWRELEVIARGGDADLLIDLPGKPGRDGLRVRLEPVVSREEVHGAIAFLGAAEARTAVAPRPRADGFDALFGTDPALCAAKQAGERFAATPLPVLLLAKTGTGKELLARAIHASGPRRNQPFVAINCGALSPHLLESELFGYAPGAFTGANPRGHDGKIGAARGGTLFLDEVAEMPGPLQALLLRVLEDGT